MSSSCPSQLTLFLPVALHLTCKRDMVSSILYIKCLVQRYRKSQMFLQNVPWAFFVYILFLSTFNVLSTFISIINSLR